MKAKFFSILIFILTIFISTARSQSTTGTLPQWTSIPVTFLKEINSNTLKYNSYPRSLKDSSDIDEIMVVVAIDILDSKGNKLIASGTPVQTTVNRKISKQYTGGSIEIMFKSILATDGQQILLTGNHVEKGKSRNIIIGTSLVIGLASIVVGGVYAESGENDLYAAAGVIAGFGFLIFPLIGEAAPAKISNGQVIKNVFSASSYKIKIAGEIETANNITPASNYPENVNETGNQLRGGGDPLKGLNVSKANELSFGNYYALVIGIDKYSGLWQPLKNAIKDAEAIKNTINEKYKFDQIKTLYNEQATRANIISELEWFSENVKPEDNVFIYYSGHGEYKQNLNKGFWVPFDASTTSTSSYVSNSDIQTFLNGINSKHTLLISDACFSGDIFRGNTISVPFEDSEKYFHQVNAIKSRQALTSGGLEPVMDGGREGHSVFAFYLLQAFNENNSKYFDASQVFSKIKIPVVNNSNQVPILSHIKDTGDEGGQFIFIRK